MPESPIHTDLSQVSKSFAVLGGFIVSYGLISYVAKERLYLSEPMIAMTVGIIVGPYVLNWVNPSEWAEPDMVNEITYQFTRLVLGTQVLFTGISLPAKYIRKEILSLTVLLTLIMTTAWFVTSLLIWGIIPGLSFLEALVIGAAVTPTDPVLSNSIVKGRFADKHVPSAVRNIINAEAGANDGLGFPYLFLGLYLLARFDQDRGTSVGEEIGRWAYGVLVYQILLSIAYGTVIGFVARKTLRWAEERQLIDRESFFSYGLALALFTLGTTGLFGSDDIFACFVAGNSFTWDDRYRISSEESDVQDILDMLLNNAAFLYLGLIIPWDAYKNNAEGIAGWRFVVLAVLVLLLRRPPWVLASYKIIPALSNWKEATFTGWFGPIGIGAIFYGQVALRELPNDELRNRLREIYNPIILFLVFASVLCHGVTIPIGKLGPNVVRRTATLTQTKSITFSWPTSRPTSEAGDKQPWNPFHALSEFALDVVCFWRKDSFWRRKPKNGPGAVRGKTISSPAHAVKQRVVGDKADTNDTTESGSGCSDGDEERQRVGQAGTGGSEEDAMAEGHGDKEAGEGGGMPRFVRPPPASLSLPLAHSVSDVQRAGTASTTPAAVPDDARDSKRFSKTPPSILQQQVADPSTIPRAGTPVTSFRLPGEPASPPAVAASSSSSSPHLDRPAPVQSSGSHLAQLRRMLGDEMDRERKEAAKETEEGWPEEVKKEIAALVVAAAKEGKEDEGVPPSASG
ncbi:unnamed protein product [Tilletia controversa]|nr:unnamed protein product [Tilletia controversa]CAD6925475.1 unnamed protein product [Tilletia controversa]CAD6928887.1 unnamed protein product [Tilletia controversa]CAD6942846.1 unnamed protein product [Tilletia controversa]CAD6971053.1 unnamed protein product [Tilletia controversa]